MDSLRLCLSLVFGSAVMAAPLVPVFAAKTGEEPPAATQSSQAINYSTQKKPPAESIKTAPKVPSGMHLIKVPPPQKITKPNESKKPEPPVVKVPGGGQPSARPQAPVQANLPQQLPDTQLDAIRDANDARIFEEAREAADALREQANLSRVGGDGANPDLGLGGSKDTGPGGKAVDFSDLPGHDVAGFERPEGTEYLPKLPSNQDKGPSGSVFRPSGDLRGAMSGAASTVETAEWSNDDGSTTYVKTVSDDDGLLVTTNRYTERKNSNGDLHVTEETEYANGWTYVEQTTYDENSDIRYRRRAWFDPHGSGSPEWERTRSPGSMSGRAGDPMRVPPVPEDSPFQSQDPNNAPVSPQFARWASQFDHSKKQSARSPDRVNPGPDGAMPQRQAPRLVAPEDQLVINPSPENEGGQAREISAEQAAAWAAQMKVKIKGPGGHPGNAPGDAGLNSKAAEQQSE